MSSTLVIESAEQETSGMESRVKDLRTAAGLTQQALAEAVHVSRQTINSIEAGRYDPSLTLAVHLARYFDTQVEELFHVP